MPIVQKDPPKVPTAKERLRDRKPKWWNAEDKNVADRLWAWAENIERQNWNRRWSQLAFYRYMTGRPTCASFNYSMCSRPSSVVSAYGRSTFMSPTFNVMAQCDSVLENRVYSSRPPLLVDPIAGSVEARREAIKLTRWLDGSFHDLNVFNVAEQCAADARMWGTGWVKVDVSLDNKKVEITRLIDDEVLVDEAEVNVSDDPRTTGIRIFISRDDLLDIYADDKEACAAILTAKNADLGLYFGADIDTSDMLVLIEAWHIGTEKSPGRHVMALSNYALVDTEFKKDHAPLAKLYYQKMGFRGKGLAEATIGMQRRIEKMMLAMDQNVDDVAHPRAAIEKSSKVNPASLSAIGPGIKWFHYSGIEPKWFIPQAITKDQFGYLEMLVRSVRELVGISDQAASQGGTPSFRSGLAIERQSQMDQGRFKTLSLHYEDFIRQIGELLVEAGEKCKPTVTLPGRTVQQIKWSDIKLERSSYWLRAFPYSALPQSIAGKTEWIEDAAQEGRISKMTQTRLEQMPDVDGYQDLASAAEDNVDLALDRLVFENEYVPPEPFCDLSLMLQQAQTRYLYEMNEKTPRDRLDLILQFVAAVEELIDEASANGAPPPAFGMQPPAPGQAIPSQGPLPAQYPVQPQAA